jgi:hypothetical protein
MNKNTNIRFGFMIVKMDGLQSREGEGNGC